jgi:hypothetical protein
MHKMHAFPVRCDSVESGLPVLMIWTRLVNIDNAGRQAHWIPLAFRGWGLTSLLRWEGMKFSMSHYSYPIPWQKCTIFTTPGSRRGWYMNPEDVQALESNIEMACQGLSGAELTEAAMKFCEDQKAKVELERGEQKEVPVACRSEYPPLTMLYF